MVVPHMKEDSTIWFSFFLPLSSNSAPLPLQSTFDQIK